LIDDNVKGYLAGSVNYFTLPMWSPS